MRYEIFTDPIYHAERHIDFEPEDVLSLEERFARLFLRGRHRVTVLKLKSGRRVLLKGRVAGEIQAQIDATRAETPDAPDTEKREHPAQPRP